MYFIKKILNQKYEIFTMIRYESNDERFSETITKFIELSDDIVNHFQGFTSIDSLSSYIDFLFLQYITLYEEDTNYISEEKQPMFNELICYAKEKVNTIPNKEIINFTKANYVDIFNFDNDYISQAIIEYTFDIYLRFRNGYGDVDIIHFLINKKPHYILDNYEKLKKILTKDDNFYLRQLLLENNNIFILGEYHFEKICVIIEDKFNCGNHNLVNQLCESIWEYKNKLFEIETIHLYTKQKIAREIFKTFYKVKFYLAKDAELLLNQYNKKIDIYLEKHGQKFTHKISSEPYQSMMRKFDEANISSFYKYLSVTHWFDESKYMLSIIEKEMQEYKPNFIDFASSTNETNDYFTTGRKNALELLIAQYSMNLLYWVDGEEKINEFTNNFKVVIYSIFELLEYDISVENINEGTELFVDAISSSCKNHVLFHEKIISLISFFEKILRLINLSVDKQAYFSKNKLTLGTFLSSNLENNVFRRLIGSNQYRILRYYLLTDSEGVGYEYRNKLAHNRDIDLTKIHIGELLMISWIIISAINSILVNLINNESD